MEPISKTHYFKDGAFYPRSKWAKRIKYTIAAIFTAVSLFYINDTAVYAQKTVHEYKSPYIEFIRSVNPKLTYKDAREIFVSAIKWGSEFKVDPKLILAIAKVESKFVPYSISPTGALGLMQVIPKWHRQKIVDARDKIGNPELFGISTGIYLGTRVIKECLVQTSNKVTSALSCYSGNTPGYETEVLAAYSKIQKI